MFCALSTSPLLRLVLPVTIPFSITVCLSELPTSLSVSPYPYCPFLQLCWSLPIYGPILAPTYLAQSNILVTYVFPPHSIYGGTPLLAPPFLSIVLMADPSSWRTSKFALEYKKTTKKSIIFCRSELSANPISCM